VAGAECWPDRQSLDATNRGASAHRTAKTFAARPEVLDAIVNLGTAGGQATINSTCTRPAALDPQADADLIDLMRSPYPLP